MLTILLMRIIKIENLKGLFSKTRYLFFSLLLYCIILIFSIVEQLNKMHVSGHSNLLVKDQAKIIGKRK